MNQPLQDTTRTSISCDGKVELPQISNDKRKAEQSNWSESLALSMQTLAADPEELAKIENRAF
jgi:hypothetical protein